MALDARDKEIKINSHVRYVDTGTIGEVIDIKTEYEIDWVKIDKTDLWYRSKLVEVLDKKDIKEKFTPLKDDDVDVESMKDNAFKFENMDAISGGAEGGG